MVDLSLEELRNGNPCSIICVDSRKVTSSAEHDGSLKRRGPSCICIFLTIRPICNTEGVIGPHESCHDTASR